MGEQKRQAFDLKGFVEAIENDYQMLCMQQVALLKESGILRDLGDDIPPLNFRASDEEIEDYLDDIYKALGDVMSTKIEEGMMAVNKFVAAGIWQVMEEWEHRYIYKQFAPKHLDEQRNVYCRLFRGIEEKKKVLLTRIESAVASQAVQSVASQLQQNAAGSIGVTADTKKKKAKA